MTGGSGRFDSGGAVSSLGPAEGRGAEATNRLPDTALIDATIKRLSQVVGTPWASGEKQASLAAWLVLPG